MPEYQVITGDSPIATVIPQLGINDEMLRSNFHDVVSPDNPVDGQLWVTNERTYIRHRGKWVVTSELVIDSVEGKTRQKISSVADGVSDSDAPNMKQVRAVRQFVLDTSTELEDDISRVEDISNEALVKVNDIILEVTDIKTDISSINNDIGNMGSNLNTLTSLVNTVDGTATEANTRSIANKGLIDSTISEVDSIQSEVALLDVDIISLQSNLNILNTKVDLVADEVTDATSLGNENKVSILDIYSNIKTIKSDALTVSSIADKANTLSLSNKETLNKIANYTIIDERIDLNDIFSLSRIFVRAAVSDNLPIMEVGFLDVDIVFDENDSDGFLVHQKFLCLESYNLYFRLGLGTIDIENNKSVFWQEWVNKSSSTALPTGTIIAWAGLTPPAGCLECAGQSLSRTTYGALFTAIGTTWGTTSADNFKLPDFKTSARFLRSRGDGLEVGMTQEDAIRDITGSITLFSAVGYATGAFSKPSGATIYSAAGGGGGTNVINYKVSDVVPTADENRPKNAVVMYCIKAVDEYINPAQVDMAKVAEAAALKADRDEVALKADRDEVKELAGTRLWVSGEYTPIKNQPTTVLHGLSGIDPLKCRCDVLLVCKVAEHGYSVGEFALGAMPVSLVGSVYLTHAMDPSLDKTKIQTNNGNNDINIFKKTTGERTALTLSNWRYVFRIWY